MLRIQNVRVTQHPDGRMGVQVAEQNQLPRGNSGSANSRQNTSAAFRPGQPGTKTSTPESTHVPSTVGETTTPLQKQARNNTRRLELAKLELRRRELQKNGVTINEELIKQVDQKRRGRELPTLNPNPNARTTNELRRQQEVKAEQARETAVQQLTSGRSNGNMGANPQLVPVPRGHVTAAQQFAQQQPQQIVQPAAPLSPLNAAKARAKKNKEPQGIPLLPSTNSSVVQAKIDTGTLRLQQARLHKLQEDAKKVAQPRAREAYQLVIQDKEREIEALEIVIAANKIAADLEAESKKVTSTRNMTMRLESAREGVRQATALVYPAKTPELEIAIATVNALEIGIKIRELEDERSINPREPVAQKLDQQIAAENRNYTQELEKLTALYTKLGVQPDDRDLFLPVARKGGRRRSHKTHRAHKRSHKTRRTRSHRTRRSHRSHRTRR